MIDLEDPPERDGASASSAPVSLGAPFFGAVAERFKRLRLTAESEPSPAVGEEDGEAIAELPIYSARFSLEAMGSVEDYADGVRVSIPRGALETLVSPSTPDPEAGWRFWSNRDEPTLARIMFLGLEVTGFSNGLPFSCRLRSESVESWNSRLFSDGKMGVIRMPACSHSHTAQMAVDRRKCRSHGTWQEMVAELFKRLRGKNEIERVDASHFFLLRGCPLSDYILANREAVERKCGGTFAMQETTLPSGEHDRIHLTPFTASCQMYLQKLLGLEALASLEGDLTFSLEGGQKGPKSEGSRTYEVGVDFAMYFSYPD